MEIRREVLVYTVVGAVVTAVYLLISMILNSMLGNAMLSSVIGYICATVLSYILHYSLTFKAKTPHIYGVLRYIIAVIVGAGLSITIPGVIENKLSMPGSYGFFAVVIVIPIVNFFILKFFVFQKSNQFGL